MKTWKYRDISNAISRSTRRYRCGFNRPVHFPFHWRIAEIALLGPILGCYQTTPTAGIEIDQCLPGYASNQSNRRPRFLPRSATRIFTEFVIEPTNRPTIRHPCSGGVRKMWRTFGGVSKEREYISKSFLFTSPPYK